MSPGHGPPAAIRVCLILPHVTSSLTLLQVWRNTSSPSNPWMLPLPCPPYHPAHVGGAQRAAWHLLYPWGPGPFEQLL